MAERYGVADSRGSVLLLRAHIARYDGDTAEYLTATLVDNAGATAVTGR